LIRKINNNDENNKINSDNNINTVNKKIYPPVTKNVLKGFVRDISKRLTGGLSGVFRYEVVIDVQHVIASFRVHHVTLMSVMGIRMADHEVCHPSHYWIEAFLQKHLRNGGVKKDESNCLYVKRNLIA
jgi:hypothetical protein